MLKFMRDSFQHLKWILVAIVAVFILFIFTDFGGASSAGQKGDKGYAARVNGETISRREYDRALYYTQKNYEQMYRQPLTPEMLAAMGLNKQVLEGLVDQKLILQEAQRLHLGATPEEVRTKILTIPSLNPDGKFIGTDLYNRFVTTQLGYGSPSEFEDELAREITTEKMESALQNSLVVSPKAAEADFRRLSENAMIHYVLYPTSRTAATITLSPADVQAYYNANQSTYAHGEQRQLKYLVADVNRIKAQIVPSDDDLKKRYEANKETYKHAESAHILHILIKVDRNAAPAVDAAARAKAEGLVKQLRAGADFAKLAKENSGDPSSSARGGDMNFIDRGTTVAPFDQAAFSIPLNQISDPIRSTEFGYHIIKVLERKPAGYRTFEEVKPQLLAEAAGQMAKDQARDEITRLATRMKTAKPASAEAFSAMANDKVSSNDSQWFAKNEPVNGLGPNAALSTWTFAAKQGDVGDPIGTTRGPAIPYLVGIRPPGISPLVDIKDKVESDARKDKARQLATEALAKGLPAPTVDAVAAKVGIPATDTTVTRQGYISGFQGDTSALVEAAMKAPIGVVTGPVSVNDGAVVFQVTQQNKGQAKSDEEIHQYMDAFRSSQMRSLRAVLLQRLRKASKIDVNQALLVAPSAQQPGDNDNGDSGPLSGM